MKADAEEEVWLERDNYVEWVAMNDDVPVSDLSGLTRVAVCIGSTVVDSSQWGSSIIWWTDSVSAKTLPDGTSYSGDVIRAKLGQASGFTSGEYEGCRLVIYDGTYTNGLVVSDDITITVYDACVT